MSLAAEAELCALFVTCCKAIPSQNFLNEMGHKQPQKPMHTDNTTDISVANNDIFSKRLKSMDMRINWLQFRIAQEQFRHYWKPGPTNLGDYSTENHAVIYHCTLRPTYLTPKKYLDLLQKINQVFGAAAA